jgi:hypothetical protein
VLTLAAAEYPSWSQTVIFAAIPRSPTTRTYLANTTTALLQPRCNSLHEHLSTPSMDADQASAAQYQGQDPRAANLTPTSDYSLNPSSARSGSFPEYIQRSYGAGQAPGGMAQQQSPSMPLSDGQANDHHQQQQLKSDSDVPIDPSIAAATSPTYSHQQQYSPYTPHHDMQHYPGHPQTPMYASRPEWAGQYPQPGMHYGHPATSGPPAPAMVSPVQRPPTVSMRDCDFLHIRSTRPAAF